MASDQNLVIDVTTLPVFQLADLFPMIHQDGLNDLADDIRENGQQEPVVVAMVDGAWVLVDGRNRLAACKIAGIEPTYRVLDSDPTTYIVSANIHRRHLNKGQQAMAVAMAYPETQQGKKRTSEINSEASDRYINYARYIIRNNPSPEGQKYPDRCLAVMMGIEALNDAYLKTKDDVKAREEEERVRQENAEKLEDVRKRHPDIAGLVDDERISLTDALAMAESRDFEKSEKERIAREAREEQERRERESEEARLAEEERRARAEKKAERERYEANLAAFHQALSFLLQGAGIVRNPADCEDPSRWRGTWTTFNKRYGFSPQETRERLSTLQDKIPFIFKVIESMRDE